ncbi:hypothetical protein F5B22DRAFT_659472 [Xylaria bambusicola]|uniref:uncharacterized protein n=1 Tax=Xylaria bambusicola TaxID=326684 RepID=UPI00200774BA|nr:uncharacterized protein F5B22DRAFT_659472 [Xylaria bambusicola]KAI0523736.1 hypothetical protein F5B22DRAFT_659472 [Xylaria bambusicola]
MDESTHETENAVAIANAKSKRKPKKPIQNLSSPNNAATVEDSCSTGEFDASYKKLIQGTISQLSTQIDMLNLLTKKTREAKYAVQHGTYKCIDPEEDVIHVIFSRAFKSVPQITVGFSSVDLGEYYSGGGSTATVEAISVTPTRFTVRVVSGPNTFMRDFSVVWIAKADECDPLPNRVEPPNDTSYIIVGRHYYESRDLGLEHDAITI